MLERAHGIDCRRARTARHQAFFCLPATGLHLSCCWLCDRGRRSRNSDCTSVTGHYKRLTDVADDGRLRMLVENSSEVPILVVGYCFVENIRSPAMSHVNKWSERACVLNYEFDNMADTTRFFLDMLEKNAKLLTDEFKASLRLPKGFSVSVLLLIRTDVPDFRVFERCALPSCGEEHRSAHESEHAPLCVPRRQRPFVQIPRRYCESRAHMIAGRAGPIPAFSDVGVFKAALIGPVIQIYDKHFSVICGFIVDSFPEGSRVRDVILTQGMQPGATVYCQGDMSVEGRVLIYLDKALKCVW